MISREIDKLGRRTVKKEAPDLLEAQVSAAKASGRYDVTFRHGGRAYNIKGPEGLKAGQSVAVQAFPGAVRKYIISGESYPGGDVSITEATV